MPAGNYVITDTLTIAQPGHRRFLTNRRWVAGIVRGSASSPIPSTLVVPDNTPGMGAKFPVCKAVSRSGIQPCLQSGIQSLATLLVSVL
jgi:hypothetical protein